MTTITKGLGESYATAASQGVKAAVSIAIEYMDIDGEQDNIIQALSELSDLGVEVMLSERYKEALRLVDANEGITFYSESEVANAARGDKPHVTTLISSTNIQESGQAPDFIPRSLGYCSSSEALTSSLEQIVQSLKDTAEADIQPRDLIGAIVEIEIPALEEREANLF